jgi:hypothetical protein
VSAPARSPAQKTVEQQSSHVEEWRVPQAEASAEAINLAGSQVVETIADQFKPKLTARRMAIFPVPEVREGWIFS